MNGTVGEDFETRTSPAFRTPEILKKLHEQNQAQWKIDQSTVMNMQYRPAGSKDYYLYKRYLA
jgi:hypothetical protein